jgi:dTMP kinase
VLLDLDPGEGLRRANHRPTEPDPHTLHFAERVRYAFLDLSAKDPNRYLVLDASRPQDAVAGLILDRVIGLLPTRPDPAVSPPPAPLIAAPLIAGPATTVDPQPAADAPGPTDGPEPAEVAEPADVAQPADVAEPAAEVVGPEGEVAGPAGGPPKKSRARTRS